MFGLPTDFCGHTDKNLMFGKFEINITE